jgi:tetratricopeptide (TPR) repeat protein
LIGRVVAGKEKDSLSSIIKNDPSDSAKVVAYTNLVITIINDPKAAMEVLNEMHAFCDTRIKDKKTKALCYRKIGILYSNLNYFDKALEYTFKSADIFESLGDKSGLGNCYNNIASYYNHKGNFTSDMSFYNRSIDYHLKALKLRLEADPNQVHNSYNNIGSTYMSMDEYEKALEYFNKAFEVYVKLNDQNGIDMINTNIGDCYLYLVVICI